MASLNHDKYMSVLATLHVMILVMNPSLCDVKTAAFPQNVYIYIISTDELNIAKN